MAAPRATTGSSLDAPPSTVVVPVEAIRAFLAAQQVAASDGTTSLDAAKDSVVRVICVRK